MTPMSHTLPAHGRLAAALLRTVPMTVSQDQLLDLIAQEAIIDRDTLKPEAKLEDLGISSLDLITLLFEVEERYGVVIEEGDMPPMTSLGEMVDFLLGRLNAEAAPA